MIFVNTTNLHTKIFLLLLILALLLPSLYTTTYSRSSEPIDVDLQLPPGEHHRENASIELPSSISRCIFWLVITSLTSRSLSYNISIQTLGGVKLLSFTRVEGSNRLEGYGDRALFYGVLEVSGSGSLIIHVETDAGFSKTLRLDLVMKKMHAHFVYVYLPVTYLGDPDPRRAPFTLVESRPSLLLRALGIGEEHTVLGYLRVDVEASRGMDTLLIVGYIEDEHGNRAPIASEVLAPGAGEPFLRTAVRLDTCSNDVCRGYVVIPLWSLVPMVPPGRYRLVLELYLPGSDRPMDRYVHEVRIELLGYGDIAVPMAIAVLGLCTAPFVVRMKDSRNLAIAGLTAAAILALSRIPGTIVFRLASVLGPFDWIVYSPITTGIYYALLTVCALETRSCLATALAVAIEWLLGVVVLGVGNIVLSILWMLTTFGLVAISTAIAKALRWRPLPVLYGLARALDAYVDINIYAYAYRLFYADWYIASYALGTALYAFIGSFIAYRVIRRCLGLG